MAQQIQRHFGQNSPPMGTSDPFRAALDPRAQQALDRLRSAGKRDYDENILFPSPLIGSPDHFLVANGIVEAHADGRLTNLSRKAYDLFKGWADDYTNGTDRLLGDLGPHVNTERPSVQQRLESIYYGSGTEPSEWYREPPR